MQRSQLPSELPGASTRGARIIVCGLFLLSPGRFFLSAQMPAAKKKADETVQKGYWIDRPTGLMWAGKDNGTDASQKDAAEFCQSLKLAGFKDWRLPSLKELQGIYDPSVVSGTAVTGEKLHIKGSIQLTGTWAWSSTPATSRPTAVGEPPAPVSSGIGSFYFADGFSDANGDIYASRSFRAVCVRSLTAQSKPKSSSK
jgi:Protein of unknown function (DUF1566)